jgi:hypothetical protein
MHCCTTTANSIAQLRQATLPLLLLLTFHRKTLINTRCCYHTHKRHVHMHTHTHTACYRVLGGAMMPAPDCVRSCQHSDWPRVLKQPTLQTLHQQGTCLTTHCTCLSLQQTTRKQRPCLRQLCTGWLCEALMMTCCCMPTQSLLWSLAVKTTLV